MRVKVFCIFNDPGRMAADTAASLQAQVLGPGLEVRWELLDNRDNHRFDAIRPALNQSLAAGPFDLWINLHQDLRFGPDFLDRLVALLAGLRGPRGLGVAGVAGADWHGAPLGFLLNSGAAWGRPWVPVRPLPASTVDELCFALDRPLLEAGFRFDAAIPGWHVYAVEASAWAHRHGFGVWVIPLFLEHRSPVTNRARLRQAQMALAARYPERVWQTTMGPVAPVGLPRRTARAALDRWPRLGSAVAAVKWRWALRRNDAGALAASARKRWLDRRFAAVQRLRMVTVLPDFPPPQPVRLQSRRFFEQGRDHAVLDRVYCADADLPAVLAETGAWEWDLVEDPAATVPPVALRAAGFEYDPRLWVWVRRRTP